MANVLGGASGAQVFIWLGFYGLQGGTVANSTVVALYIENEGELMSGGANVLLGKG